MHCSPPGTSVHEVLRQEYGVGCHFLLQGIFLDPGIEAESPALTDAFFTTEPRVKPTVNRMLPGRDKHFGLRLSDQGRLSEDVAFDVESWKMRGISPVKWREFISGIGNCSCRWEGKECDTMEGQKEGHCAGVRMCVKKDSMRWDLSGRRGPGERAP